MVTWLRNDDRRARTAYFYAQGYLFAHPPNREHRDRILALVKRLGDKVSCKEMPYPPPWLTPGDGL